MFTSPNPADLRRQMDRFAVPMFIARRDASGAGFEIMAINARYEAESGMIMDNVTDSPLTDLLPPAQAAASAARFDKCLRERAPQQFREVLDMPRGSLIWDTTLHYAAPPGQEERIIGSAILLEQIEEDDHDVLAFEDMRYLAAASCCELGKVSALLDAVDAGHIDRAALAGSAGMLAGLCRAIDHKLNEIRSVADRKVTNRESRSVRRARMHLIDRAPRQVQSPDEVDAAIAALMSLVSAMPEGLEHDAMPLRQQTAAVAIG